MPGVSLFDPSFVPGVGLDDSTSRIPRLFALLIGIDACAYIKDPPEKGVVADDGSSVDAQVMEKYLRRFLGAEISILLNANASKVAIMSALRSFRSNPRIQHGDAIIIYFAGHSAEGEAPKRSTIMANDYHKLKDPHIPLEEVIEGMAEKKGNNIASFLSISHSICSD